MFVVCVVVGFVLLASKYRNDVIRSVQDICRSLTNNNDNINSYCNVDNHQPNEKEISKASDNIILADSLEKCDFAVQRICSNLSDGREKVLGFDCEWANEGPVSLLQLATYNGFCALFRLGKIGFVPPKLQELLANNCILKVGVAPYEDGKKLMTDYECAVVGTVDLRTLADRLDMPNRRSLAALCLQYLGIEMDKTLEVRCGNWNADILTKEQMEYAACDAIASIMIYRKIREGSNKGNSIWTQIAIYIKKTWGKTNCAIIHNLPKGIIDTRYRASSNRQIMLNNNYNNITNNINNINTNSNNNDNNDKKIDKQNEIIEERQSSPEISYNIQINSVPTRKEPLYHNCYLQAPDGETLCTCDRKKAEWYISKELGIKVRDEPFTVRLNFEPSGRACGEVGQFYTQIKVNQCVVCGAQDKFIKKNVVPREYRKYFPLVMKAHQSHDVLLLCPTCHVISNRNDLELRKKLAEICDAPLSRSSLSTNNDNHRRKKFISAVKALRVNNSSLPPHRKRELESRIEEFAQQSYMYPRMAAFVTDELANKRFTTASSEQTSCSSHGMKVVQYFTKCEGGLVVLERMWREHFLHTMHPQYLPQLWSVRHNQERLEIRKVQNRIRPEDAKIAGLTR